MKYVTVILIVFFVFCFFDEAKAAAVPPGAKETPLNDETQYLFAILMKTNWGIKCQLPIRFFEVGDYQDDGRLDIVACAGGNKVDTYHYSGYARVCYTNEKGKEEWCRKQEK